MDFFDNLWEKNRIRGEIRDLQAKVRKWQGLVSDYNTCKTDIGTNISNWELAETTYQGIDLAEVNVETYFEGISAENVKTRLTDTITAINSANTTITAIQGAISSQIELIEEEITNLKEQIAGLQAELDALG